MKKPQLKKESTGQIRAKIQELLSDNTRQQIGRFHSKELDESSFVTDLFNTFDITLKKS